MDRLFTEKELFQALTETKLNKCPGIDGLPYEFYLTFWDEIKEPFLEVANEILTKGLILNARQRRTIITLVHKKGSMEDLEMWRPISLLCCDFKILAKAMSIRLKQALPFIINRNQTCGIPGRQIFDNLLTTRDILDFASKRHEPGYILSFDFHKAFDKVDIDFLTKVLKQYGFGDIYIGWIKTTLNDCDAIISNNGFYTAPVTLGRSAKQGAQESQLLYDCLGDVLARQIEQNPNIKGFRIPRTNKPHKISQYADDNTHLCRHGPIYRPHL